MTTNKKNIPVAELIEEAISAINCMFNGLHPSEIEVLKIMIDHYKKHGELNASKQRYIIQTIDF